MRSVANLHRASRQRVSPRSIDRLGIGHQRDTHPNRNKLEPRIRTSLTCLTIGRLPAALLGGLLAGLFAALSACGPGSAHSRSPAETLRSYADALDEGRIEEAYVLLSDEAKREMSLDAFRRVTRENPAEMREVAAALRRPGSAPIVTATIDTPEGDPLVLRYESGRWRLDASAIDLYSQATPRQAVVSFVRAFERGRYDVLMRFVPEAKKAGLDAAKLKAAWEGPQKQEMDRLVPAVKSAIPTATFEQVADRATMPFGAVGTVQLVQEHGIWKIEDFD